MHNFRTEQGSASPAGRLSAGTGRLRPRAGDHRSRRGGGAAQLMPALHASAALLSFARLFALILLSLVVKLALPSSALAVPPGTVINNAASVTYIKGGVSFSSASTVVSITTVAARTSAVLELLQYAPGSPASPVSLTEYSTSGTPGGPFSPLPPPVTTRGAAIDLANPVPLAPATVYHMGEPVFIRLTDPDQNNSAAVRDTVLVTIGITALGEREVLRLTETGPNTGVFTGYVQTGSLPAAAGNGILNVQAASTLSATYTDVADATDTEARSALIDPFGIVFNSTTGQPVDGASITIVDGTGAPAAVFGDDGVTVFPSTVVSGSTIVAGGTTYAFPPGGFRFPFILPGTYRLVVAPPANFSAPSVVPTTVLQTLPGAPFVVADPGSRGELFTVNPGPSLQMDIPIDAAGAGLFLVKTAVKETAAIGDFVPYRLTVENTSNAAIVPGVTVSDRLPGGFRYRKGSARMNGAAAPDPAVSPDGRGLTFPVGILSPSGSVEISYVAEVGAGARLGKAINTALATGMLGSVSNPASATVLVTEDLFRSKATIVGQIIVDGCGDPDRSEAHGPEGIRIFREDGSYVITDKNGMFHFDAVEPGTHVVQLDLLTIPERYELMACEDNTRFAGNAFSQFVDVQGGALWRADFHLGLKPRIVGDVGIELRTALRSGPSDSSQESFRTRKDIIQYSLPVHVGEVPVRNLRLTVLLPDGAAYVPGSSALNAAPVGDPAETPGALTFRIDEAPAGWEGTLRFEVLIPMTGAVGELKTRAVLMLDTPQGKNERSPVVENVLVREVREDQRTVPDIVLHPRFGSLNADLGKADRKELDRVIRDLQKVVVRKITVTGHTDSQTINPRSKKKFSDNYALSQARAKTVADALAKALKLSPEQITIIGKGPDEPVADNRTTKGRAQNRRVELKVETSRVVVYSALRTDKDASGMKALATVGLRPGEPWQQEKRAADAGTADPKTKTDFNAAWLETAEPGLDIVWPGVGSYPNVPSTRVVVKHNPLRKVTLAVNGIEADHLNFDGSTQNEGRTCGMSVWRGISLAEGDNRLEAVEYNAAGVETGRVVRTVHYSGPPASALVVPEQSTLVADGKQPVVVAVMLFDKDGHPAREGMSGEFTVDPPYLPLQKAKDLQASPLVTAATDRVSYHVGEDGLARLELQPTARSGEAVVRVALADGIHEFRVWVKPEARDWVLVGLAEGTVGYNTVTGNMETLKSSGADDRYYEDGRVAFYAKGMIKGEWLLTLAYDSSKTTPDGRPGMYQTVDPNKYYLLYGDGAEQRYDAASAKKVYVKLERNQFYALFGDYDTGLTVTELSRYSRNFTGLKSEYKGDRVDATVFAADTNQAFVRDEIPGDGTSGLYRLSRRNIVINSESLVIETRDRFHSEVILSSKPLTRFLDYSIDYDTGTLFFKYPIFSRDENFNPVFIVVNYESFDSSDQSYNYGGRGAVRFLDKRVEVGATHVHEGRVGGSGDLSGVDATVNLDEHTKVRAEVAGTRTDQLGATAEGSAYLAELTHQSAKVDGRAYIREQGNGFGLGQQNNSETGTRKTGFDLLYRFTDHASLGGQAFRQETFQTGAVRDSAEIQARYGTARYDYFGGFRHTEDSFPNAPTLTSDQVFAGARYQLTDRLTARVQHDQTISSGATSADYPTRTTLGLDYQLTRDTVLFGAQELTKGSDRDTATTRVGMKTSPWTGMQLNSTMEQQMTESGSRLFSTTGLKQTWQVSKAWTLDAGMDRSATIRHTATYLPNPNVPPASGGEDFTALTAGAGYRAEKWSWNGRIETRTSDSENKIGLSTGAYGEPWSGHGLGAALQGFRTDTATGTRKMDGDLRVGYVFRPVTTRWIVLERLDYLESELSGGVTEYFNWRIVNNIVTNYTVRGTGQVSLQYGAKFVKESIDSTDYRGYTDLTGIEGRYDLTKKVDIGLRESMLRSWAIDQTQYSTAVSVGFTMAKNFWLSVGYNVTGFYDRDFSKADFTAQGPFIKLRMKFDQVSVAEAVKWFTGQ